MKKGEIKYEGITDAASNISTKDDEQQRFFSTFGVPEIFKWYLLSNINQQPSNKKAKFGSRFRWALSYCSTFIQMARRQVQFENGQNEALIESRPVTQIFSEKSQAGTFPTHCCRINTQKFQLDQGPVQQRNPCPPKKNQNFIFPKTV